MKEYQRRIIHKRSHYLACKKCKNRISDIWYDLSFCSIPESGLGNFLVFKEVTKENVVIEEDETLLRIAGPYTLADIHCAVCNKIVGHKFISGPTLDLKEGDFPSSNIKEGDFLLIQKKLRRAAAAEEVNLSNKKEPGESSSSADENSCPYTNYDKKEPGESSSSADENSCPYTNYDKKEPGESSSSSDENSCPYIKYDKKEPKLKGSIKSSSEYKDYAKEYQEKYKAFISINKILEPYKEEIKEYGKVYHASKGRDGEGYEEIQKQIRDAFLQIMEKRQRLVRIYFLLHQELDNLKKIIKEFYHIPNIEGEKDAEIHPTEPPSMSEFKGVVKNVYGPNTAAKTIYEDEEGYLIIVTLPFVDPERVDISWRNNLTHCTVEISSVTTSCMPFIQKNNRTFKLTDPAPEHCPPGEFQRAIQLPTRIPENAKLEADFDEGRTVLEIKVPKLRMGPEEEKK